MGFKVTSYGRWPPLPEPLAKCFSRTSSILKSGETLFDTGDSCTDCYYVASGLLKVILHAPNGMNRILSLATPGVVVGDISMIDGRPRSATIVAMEDTKLNRICQAEFHECLEKHPECYRYLINILAARLREADETIAALAFLSVRGRVAHAFLDLSQLIGEKRPSGEVILTHKISRQDLADFAGVARENVSRIVKEFKANKAIVGSDKGRFILDISVLENEIEL